MDHFLWEDAIILLLREKLQELISARVLKTGSGAEERREKNGLILLDNAFETKLRYNSKQMIASEHIHTGSNVFLFFDLKMHCVDY